MKPSLWAFSTIALEVPGSPGHGHGRIVQRLPGDHQALGPVLGHQVAKPPVIRRSEEIGCPCRLVLHHCLVKLVTVLFQPFLRIEVLRLGLEFELHVHAILPACSEESHQFVQGHQLVPSLGHKGFQLLEGLLLKDAFPVGGTLQGMVVVDDKEAVPGHADVGFKAVVARVPAGFEGRQGVLVEFHAASPVGESPDGLGLGGSRGTEGKQCDCSE